MEHLSGVRSLTSQFTADPVLDIWLAGATDVRFLSNCYSSETRRGRPSDNSSEESFCVDV